MLYWAHSKMRTAPTRFLDCRPMLTRTACECDRIEMWSCVLCPGTSLPVKASQSENCPSQELKQVRVLKAARTMRRTQIPLSRHEQNSKETESGRSWQRSSRWLLSTIASLASHLASQGKSQNMLLRRFLA